MITVTKKHSFSSAHRLYNYNGQCEHLHGHNYIVEISIISKELNNLGMVIDFDDIKKILIVALDQIWDHKTLLYNQDPLCQKLSDLLNDGSVCAVPFNPTAENMAAYLGTEFFPTVLKESKVQDDIKVISVTVYETINNCATWHLASLIPTGKPVGLHDNPE